MCNLEKPPICLTNQPGYFFKCSIFPFLIHCAQDFVEAGANIVITNTYQCNLEEFGNDQNAFKEFINDAVEVAKLSGAEVVAGSIGPYGAKYKDGTSYTGIYNDIPIGMDEKEFLKKWHLPRIQCLIKNGVDILAFETCPKLIEGLAFSELIQELQFPGFICFQCRYLGDKIDNISRYPLYFKFLKYFHIIIVSANKKWAKT